MTVKRKNDNYLKNRDVLNRENKAKSLLNIDLLLLNVEMNYSVSLKTIRRLFKTTIKTYKNGVLTLERL